MGVIGGKSMGHYNCKIGTTRGQLRQAIYEINDYERKLMFGDDGDDCSARPYQEGDEDVEEWLRQRDEELMEDGDV